MRLRPATPGDRAFLLALYADTRAAELSALPWDEAQRAAFVAQQFAAQEAHYHSYGPGTRFEVIEVDGRPAGRLIVHRGAGEIRIVDVTLAPAHRGAGIGRALLRDLQDEAARADRALVLHVEHGNRAAALYERLGFREVADDGLRRRLTWTAADQPKTAS